jgi:Flp pilus assembly protein TadD
MRGLGDGCGRLGRYAEAEPLLQKALEGMKVALGDKHPDTLITRSMLAILYLKMGRLAEAERQAMETYQTRRAVLGEMHFATMTSEGVLAGVYLAQGRQSDADPLLHKFRENAQRRQDRLPSFAILRFAELGRALGRQGDFAEAEWFLRLYVDIAGKNHADGWRRSSSLSALGACLLGRKKYTEAEPLLLKGHAGLRQYEEKIPINERRERMTEALQWLVQLYEETDKPDEAAKWRKELAQAAAKP